MLLLSDPRAIVAAVVEMLLLVSLLLFFALFGAIELLEGVDDMLLLFLLKLLLFLWLWHRKNFNSFGKFSDKVQISFLCFSGTLFHKFSSLNLLSLSNSLELSLFLVADESLYCSSIVPLERLWFHGQSMQSTGKVDERPGSGRVRQWKVEDEQEFGRDPRSFFIMTTTKERGRRV
jgi:hypothetical protein